MDGKAGMRPGVDVELGELLALRLRAAELDGRSARRSADLRSGLRHSPFRGRGMDYAESRPYAAGDDVRHIDWRVTARSGRMHTKLYQAERERVTAVLLDRSSAMDFGTRGCFKRVQAARLAALLAWHALSEGDRLAGASYGGNAGIVPAAGGRGGVLHLLGALVRWSADAGDSPPVAGGTLPNALDRLGRLLRPGAHVLLLLDHRSVDGDVVHALCRLRRHHDVAAALLVDPIELRAPEPARYPAVWRGLRSVLDLDSREARLRWEAHFTESIARAREGLRRAGVRARCVRTDEDPVAALRAVLLGLPERAAA